MQEGALTSYRAQVNNIYRNKAHPLRVRLGRGTGSSGLATGHAVPAGCPQTVQGPENPGEGSKIQLIGYGLVRINRSTLGKLGTAHLSKGNSDSQWTSQRGLSTCWVTAYARPASAPASQHRRSQATPWRLASRWASRA